MLRYASILILTVLAAAPAPTDRPHALTGQAATQKAVTCANIHDAAHCHQLPAGCETKQNPGYDAYLSFFKNQAITPSAADAQITRTFTKLSDITALDASTESFGNTHQNAHASQLAKLGEGEIDVVAGYLYYAAFTSGEACNCDLTDPADTDIHIGVGFDPALATRIAENTFKFNPDPLGTDDAKRTSIVVEMTPHYRAQFHPHWTQPAIAALKGRQVKVVGQLMADSDHNDKKQDCAFPSAVQSSCWRASIWELHPVTRLFVCMEHATCIGADSPYWQEQP
jgi:hypothetical protein